MILLNNSVPLYTGTFRQCTRVGSVLIFYGIVAGYLYIKNYQISIDGDIFN